MATQLLPVASKDNSSWFPKSDDKKKKKCYIEKKIHTQDTKKIVLNKISLKMRLFSRGGPWLARYMRPENNHVNQK